MTKHQAQLSRKASLCALMLLLPHLSATAQIAPSIQGTQTFAAQVFSGSLLDAVMLTLQSNDGVAVSKQQLDASEGSVLASRAPFDTVWTAGTSQQQSRRPQIALAGGGELASRQFSMSTGVSRRLESGIVINPRLSIERTRDDGFNASGPSYSNLAINFTIPLLKGRGSAITTAQTAAAELTRDAARDSYRHTLAASIARTVSAYWDWISARQSFELAETAQQRTTESLAIAKKLAAGDEIPRADLLKYDVRRIAQDSALERSAQQLRSAALALAQAMNVPPELITLKSATKTTNTDAFPLTQTARLELLSDNMALSRLMASSSDLRLDLRAAKFKQLAAQKLADTASRDSSNQLDLGLNVGYTGLVEGRSSIGAVAALGNPARGPNIGITLNYTFPVEKFERKGLITQRNAIAEQARIEEQALRLRINGDARNQLDALRTAIKQLEKASEQRRLQTLIFGNEKRSYQAGLSTLLELFTVESQLNASQTDWVEAQRNFAQALVLFRFQTGRLLPGDDEGGSLRAIGLTSLPEASELVGTPHTPDLPAK